MFFFRFERTPQGICAGIVVLLSLLYVGATFAAVGRQLAGTRWRYGRLPTGRWCELRSWRYRLYHSRRSYGCVTSVVTKM